MPRAHIRVINYLFVFDREVAMKLKQQCQIFAKMVYHSISYLVCQVSFAPLAHYCLVTQFVQVQFIKLSS